MTLDSLSEHSEDTPPRKRPHKPIKATKAQLYNVINAVFSEADKDLSGDLDLGECRTFLKKLMRELYPKEEWNDERFK